MTALTWDVAGERTYETGCDHGVLYLPDPGGAFVTGFAWNGLVSVTEAPEGAEATPQYADNIKYLNLVSVEDFKATIEAFTYPNEFAECDGSAQPENGILIGQQQRKLFGLSYRTKVGNDLDSEAGYKLHLVWNALAAPSEKGYTTVNDSPEAITFSWEMSTTPVPVTGYSPTASMTIDSTKVDPTALATLETALYGTVGIDPALPQPDAVLAMFAGSVTEVFPTEPAFDSPSETITIPSVTGVIYKRNGIVLAAGALVITTDTIINAVPANGYKFPAVSVNAWYYDYTP